MNTRATHLPLVLACALFVCACPRQGAPPESIKEPPVRVSSASDTPSIPTSTTTPHDDALAPPPVAPSGGGNLDLSLSRTVMNFDIEVDLSVFDRVDTSNWNAIFQQLAADPTWRVTEYQNAIVAMRRIADASGTWQLNRHGYHSAEGGYTWRALLRFTAWDHDHPWSNNEAVTRVAASAPSMRLSPSLVHQDPWAGQYVTALAVEGRDLSLELHEIGPIESRPSTFEAFGSVPPLIINSIGRAPRIIEGGFDSMLMPKGEPVTGEARLQLQSIEQGILELRARLNPGEPGWCWARITHGKRVWEESTVAAASREAIGYSRDPTQTFLMQAQLPVPQGEGFNGELEIWFQPADRAGDVRRIASTPVSVPAR